MHLRAYQPGDETQLWGMVQALNQAPPEWQDWLRQLQNSQSLVAEYDHQLVGYASLPSPGDIEQVYVRQDWQRRGIASLLLLTLQSHGHRSRAA